MEIPQASPVPLPELAGKPPFDPGTRGFTVDLSASAAAGGRVPEIKEQGFIEKAGAAGFIGRALVNTGDSMARLAEEQLKSITRHKIEEARVKLDAGRQHIAALQSKEPDETKWAGIFERESTKWGDDLLNDKTLSPAAREDIESQVNLFKLSGRSGTLQSSAQQSFKKEHALLEGGRIKALQDGNFTQADEYADKQVAAGLIHPDTGKRLKVQNSGVKARAVTQAGIDGRKADQESFATLLDDNPWQAQADAGAGKFTHFDIKDRELAHTEAGRRIAKRQRDGMETERAWIVMGAPESTEDGIRARGTDLRLQPAEIQSLVNFRNDFLTAQAKNAPFDWHEAAALHADVRAYDAEKFPNSEEAGKAYGELMKRTEVLCASGQETGKITKAVIGSLLYDKHPYQEHRVTNEETAARKALETSLDGFRDEGAFGPKTRQVRVKKLTKENGEHEVEVFEDQPDADTARQRIRASQLLAPEYGQAVKRGEVNPNDILSVDKWIRPRIAFQMAGEKVKQDAGLKSGSGSLKDAGEALKNIIKP